ncbi:hypothetical protein [Pseudomonas reactans]
MIFMNKTNFTSDPFTSFAVEKGRVGRELYLTITGLGPVAVEMLQEDGVWRSFPESTFTGPGAYILEVAPTQVRVVISGGPTTVEVRT